MVDLVIKLLIVILVIAMLIHYVNKMYIFNIHRRGKDHCKPPKPPGHCKAPIVCSLVLGSVTVQDVNNNSITLNGKIMSISLVGKQRVPGQVIPLDNNGVAIDLTVWPLDQLIQPGSFSASSGDTSIVGASVDPAIPLGVVAESTGVAGTATLTFLAKNAQGFFVSGVDDVTVTEATTTTTTTTTTEAPPTAPLVSSLQVQWGTPEDVV